MGRMIVLKKVEDRQMETLISQGSLKQLSRYALYTSAFFGVGFLLPVVMQRGDINAVYEGGFIENCQLLVLFLALSAFIAGFSLAQEARGAFAILITCNSIAIVRELDRVFSKIPVLGWHGPMAIAVMAGVFFIYRYRSLIRGGVDRVLSGHAFPLLWCGFMAAVPFGQLIGHFLTVLLGDDYTRSYKQLVQECSELLGYLLILIGALELVWTDDAGH